LNIFRNHLAPELGITHRFVGQEPLCVVTNEYNQQMKKILSRPSTSPSIEVVELERIEYKGEPISASRVRKLMQEKNVEEIRHLVPPTTYALIETMLSEEKK
jgi:[citrate (pro-3S)-lyase] ligase